MTRNKDKTLAYSQFDRWGRPLGDALSYAIRGNLTALLSGAAVYTYPWNPALPVKYQIIMEVTRLEMRLAGDITFMAKWAVLDAQERRMLLAKRSRFHRSVRAHDYFGLIEALNDICAELSGQMAHELISLKADQENPSVE